MFPELNGADHADAFCDLCHVDDLFDKIKRSFGIDSPSILFFLVVIDRFSNRPHSEAMT